MNITLPRADLAPALAAVTRIVERRNTIPILGCLLLRGEDDALALTASDLDIEMTIRLPAAIETPGATTVAAHAFAAFVQRLPEDADVALVVGDDGLTIRSGRARATLPTLPATDFPILAPLKDATGGAVDAAGFAQMLDVVAFALATDEGRYYLNGAHLHALEQDGRAVLRAVATDGHRLAWAQIDRPAALADWPGVIVPRKSVGELQRLARAADGEMTLTCDSVKLRAVAGAATLTTKLIDGTFPDYHRVIPTQNNKRLRVDTARLAAALQRIVAVSDARGSVVRIDLDEDRLAVSLGRQETGRAASEEIDVDWDAAPMTIGVNARYALDVIDALDVDEALIRLDSPGAPILLSGRPDALFLVMPAKV